MYQLYWVFKLLRKPLWKWIVTKFRDILYQNINEFENSKTGTSNLKEK